MAALNYLETGCTDPAWNLAFEEFVLTHKTEEDWLILWQNENAVIIGLNQNTEEEINRPFVEAHGVRVVRRTTGGGAVYHDLGNLNYSFLQDAGNPDSLTLTRFTKPVCAALRSMGLDAAATGRNDITVGGRKVSGTAQRLYKNRILHHGTLLFDSDPAMVEGTLRADPEKFRSKSVKSVRSRIGNIRSMLPEDMDMNAFRTRILAELTRDGLVRRELTAEEKKAVAELAERKYRCWEWNFGASPPFDAEGKKRFAGGTLQVCLNVREGRIAEAAFRGDFMALEPCAPVGDALRGVRFDREDVAAVLGGFDLRHFFGSISREEVLETIFGEEQD